MHVWQAPKDVDAIELLGGGSRVPRLQAELTKALGGRPLDKCVLPAARAETAPAGVCRGMASRLPERPFHGQQYPPICSA